MQYLNNLLDVVPVHLFTASPLTSQQMVFIHPSTTTEFACTFSTNKVALPCSTPQMVQPVAQPHAHAAAYVIVTKRYRLGILSYHERAHTSPMS